MRIAISRSRRLGFVVVNSLDGTRFSPCSLCWICYLHVLGILVHCPKDYLSALTHTDQRWIDSQDFVTATSHAICVSRLILVILPHIANGMHSPVFLPSVVLRAGWIHVLSLISVPTSSDQELSEEAAQSLRLLLSDTLVCLTMLQISSASWKHVHHAYKVFETIAVSGISSLQGKQSGTEARSSA